MKPKISLRSLLSCSSMALLATTSLQAQTTYYWDNNGTTSNFGTAGGTWAAPTTGSTTQGWSTSATGALLPGSVTTATNSTLNFGNGANGLAAGTITVSGTVNSGNMNFAPGSATTPAGAITLSGGIINFASGATITFNKISDNLQPPTPSTFTGDVTINSEISGSGNLSLLHSGNFRGTFNTTLGVISNTGNVTFGHVATTSTNPTTTFIFSGASTYTGSTNVSVFTSNSLRLQLGIANGLSTTSVLNFGSTAGSGSGREINFNLNGFSQTLAGVSGTSSGLRVMRIQNTSATAATLSINGSGNSTFTGILGSDGIIGSFNLSNGNNFSVVKEGSGVWTLEAQATGAATNSAAAPNSYTGLTTINGGAIQMRHAGALGSTAAGTVVNGSTTASSGNARLELAGGISTNSGEDLTINGAGNFNGALTSTSGTNKWQGNVTIGSAGTRIGATANAILEVSGVIDSGFVNTGLNIRTANTTDSAVILSGANTYLGETTLVVGRLQIAGADDRLPVGTTLRLTGTTLANTTEFDLNGFNQEVAGLSLGGGVADFNSVNNSSLTGSTLTVNTTAASNYGGILKGNLGITKEGAGTLTLTGTSNSYTGATNVNDGTLIVNGNISTSSLTTVKTGATLVGSGTVGDLTIDAGGFFSPGNSPGITTVDGDYIQNGQLNAEIEGLAAGNGAGFHDQVIVNGTVTLNGLLSLTTFSGTYAANDLIFILLNDGGDAISGTFTGLAQGAVVGNYLGLDWQISYTGNSGGTPSFTGGNDVVLMAIPEPRAALLGSLGILMLLRRRRA